MKEAEGGGDLGLRPGVLFLRRGLFRSQKGSLAFENRPLPVTETSLACCCEQIGLVVQFYLSDTFAALRMPPPRVLFARAKNVPAELFEFLKHA